MIPENLTSDFYLFQLWINFTGFLGHVEVILEKYGLRNRVQNKIIDSLVFKIYFSWI